MINSNGNKGYFLCNVDGAVKFHIIFNMQMIRHCSKYNLSDALQDTDCYSDRESELKGRDIKARRYECLAAN